MHNPPKKVLSCRTDDELIKLVKAEASAKKLSSSAYLETIVLRRFDVNVDVDALKKRINFLESENLHLHKQLQEESSTPENYTGLEPEIRALKQEKLQLQEQLRKAVQDRDAMAKFQSESFPYWLSREGYYLAYKLLQKMQVRHKKKTFEELLLASLDVTCQNDGSFFMKNLRDYFQSKPKSFTSKITENAITRI